MTPGERSQSQAKVRTSSSGRGFSTDKRADAAEEKVRLRARRVGFVLMLVSSVVSVVVLYAIWSLLMAR